MGGGGYGGQQYNVTTLCCRNKGQYITVCYNGTLHNGTLHNGMFPNSTLQNGMLQKGMLQKGILQNSMLQNRTASQNITDAKRYIVLKRYMLHINLLQNGTITKRYMDIVVGYITAHYNHNQEGYTNPRIDSALS